MQLIWIFVGIYRGGSCEEKIKDIRGYSCGAIMVDWLLQVLAVLTIGYIIV